MMTLYQIARLAFILRELALFDGYGQPLALFYNDGFPSDVILLSLWLTTYIVPVDLHLYPSSSCSRQRATSPAYRLAYIHMQEDSQRTATTTSAGSVPLICLALAELCQVSIRVQCWEPHYLTASSTVDIAKCALASCNSSCNTYETKRDHLMEIWSQIIFLGVNEEQKVLFK